MRALFTSVLLILAIIAAPWLVVRDPDLIPITIASIPVAFLALRKLVLWAEEEVG